VLSLAGPFHFPCDPPLGQPFPLARILVPIPRQLFIPIPCARECIGSDEHGVSQRASPRDRVMPARGPSLAQEPARSGGRCRAILGRAGVSGQVVRKDPFFGGAEIVDPQFSSQL